MSVTLRAEMATEAARILSKYAKAHHAGAFAHPMARELAEMDVVLHRNRHAATVIVAADRPRPTRRTDWIGQRFDLPPGRIATHVAREDGGPLPDVADFDAVVTYVEDRPLTEHMERSGFERLATQITSAGAILVTWARIGHGYRPADLVTCAPIDVTVGEGARSKMLEELEGVAGWDDDYPFYSDGTWSAVSLRGFYPEDPARGVKPAEMSKAWKAEHPDDLARACEWTALAERCPTMVEFVRSVPWWREVERVRLLRMDGNDGKGGALSRHTDITDKAHGTRDGQVVRFHIPLVTHPEIKMTVWDLDGRPHAVHLEPWRAWYLDARKPHAVSNPTGVDRVHLVVDVIADASVRTALTNLPAVA